MWPWLGALVLLMGLASIPFGIWLLNASRLPTWMKGIWKWPLGDNVTRAVLRLQGWAYVLIGAGALVASVEVWSPHVTAVFVGLVGMFLAGAASFAFVWSVGLSRAKVTA
jgi:hypothetical protein